MRAMRSATLSGPAPVETTSVTRSPGRRVSPAGGLVPMAWPSGTLPLRTRRIVPGGIPAWCSRSVASAWVAPTTTGTSWEWSRGTRPRPAAGGGGRGVAAGEGVTWEGLVATSTATAPATSPTTSRAASRRRRSGGAPVPDRGRGGPGRPPGPPPGFGRCEPRVGGSDARVRGRGRGPRWVGFRRSGPGARGPGAGAGAGRGRAGGPLEGLAQLRRGLEAVVGVLGQRPGDHRLERLRDVGPDGAGPAWALVHVRGGDRERRRPVERRPAADQLVQAAAERVQVGTVVDLAGGQPSGAR